MIFGKETTKNPSEQHGSDEASEHNDSGDSGIHRCIVTRLSICCDLELQGYVGVELLTRAPTGEKLLVITEALLRMGLRP